MAVLTQLSQLEDRHVPTTTLEGWRRFVESDPATFELLPRDEWAALSDDSRIAYNEARIAHHAELSLVTTSTIQEISNEGRLLTLMNQRENGARRGLIVSGAAATGKTTAIKQLGRFHELRSRRRFPVGAIDRIPVVYITAPPKGSPRKLAMEFARFLGLPLTSRANATDIADAVCQVLIDASCDIVIIDELHNVNMATTVGEDYSDHMKYFTAPPGDIRLRRHRRRAIRVVHRSPRQAARGPLRAGHHRAVPLPRRVAAAYREHGGHPAAPQPRGRVPGRVGEVPAPAHRRHDRQPVPPHPRRSHPGDPQRDRGDHRAAAGQGPHRSRRRVRRPP